MNVVNLNLVNLIVWVPIVATCLAVAGLLFYAPLMRAAADCLLTGDGVDDLSGKAFGTRAATVAALPCFPAAPEGKTAFDRGVVARAVAACAPRVVCHAITKDWQLRSGAIGRISRPAADRLSRPCRSV